MIKNRPFVTLQIAGIDLILSYPLELANHPLWSQYATFYSDQQTGFDLTVNPGEIEPTSQNITLKTEAGSLKWRVQGFRFDGVIDWLAEKGCFTFQPTRTLAEIDQILRIVYALLAYKQGGFMLHGAGVLHRGQVYVFFGPSGSGKTTVARLSPDSQVLNDDLVIFMPVGGEWYIHSTPFWNPDQIRPSPGAGPLAGLFRLVKSEQIRLSQMTPGQALAELLASIPILAQQPAYNQELMRRCQMIVEKTPVNQLYFRQEPSFWNLINPK